MEYQAAMQPSYYGRGMRHSPKHKARKPARGHAQSGRRAGSLAVMEKFPLLQRPHKYASGGRLGVMEKFPILQRPHEYATGGRLAVMEKFPLLQRPHHYAYGGALKKRVGRGPLAAALGKIPLLGMIMGPIAEAFGKGRRSGRGACTPGDLGRAYSQAAMDAERHNVQILGRNWKAASVNFEPGRCRPSKVTYEYDDSDGGGLRRRKAHGGNVARNMRTARRVEHATGMHTVRGYTRSDGTRVKAHLSANPGVAAGGRMVHRALTRHAATATKRRHRVAPHVRRTASGLVAVKGHLAHGKGGSMLRAGLAMMGPRMKQAMTANLHPAARHYTGRGRAGLLSPA